MCAFSCRSAINSHGSLQSLCSTNDTGGYLGQQDGSGIVGMNIVGEGFLVRHHGGMVVKDIGILLSGDFLDDGDEFLLYVFVLVAGGRGEDGGSQRAVEYRVTPIGTELLDHVQIVLLELSAGNVPAPWVGIVGAEGDDEDVGVHILGIGAMIPLIEEEVVNKHKWGTKEELLDLIAIAQQTLQLCGPCGALRAVAVALGDAIAHAGYLDGSRDAHDAVLINVESRLEDLGFLFLLGHVGKLRAAVVDVHKNLIVRTRHHFGSDVHHHHGTGHDIALPRLALRGVHGGLLVPLAVGEVGVFLARCPGGVGVQTHPVEVGDAGFRGLVVAFVGPVGGTSTQVSRYAACELGLPGAVGLAT